MTDNILEALAVVREITERARVMNISLVAYPIEDIETLLRALEPPQQRPTVIKEIEWRR